jgi:hypothetical protein
VFFDGAILAMAFGKSNGRFHQEQWPMARHALSAASRPERKAPCTVENQLG